MERNGEKCGPFGETKCAYEAVGEGREGAQRGEDQEMGVCGRGEEEMFKGRVLGEGRGKRFRRMLG